jgi:NAD(P)-dependent dehydrogenase (short-subunit alcohol dehydrogenase family)
VDAFGGKLAVVTGGASGMGRELVNQLAAEGCSVALCDVDADRGAEAAAAAELATPAGTVVTSHVCDVSDAAAVDRFRDEVVDRFATDHIDLLFNNAGVSGGGSFLRTTQEEWDRTFGICWGGVYHCTRAFMPLLVASADAYLVNTSSVNGFWARLMPGMPHTAYSAAKFAVKGFSEALIEDLRLNAPHVKVAVVMPGHIGTDIVRNSRLVHGASPPDEMTAEELEEARSEITARGMDASSMDDATVRGLVKAVEEGFRDTAPMSAAEAATVILDGVRAGEWRILVGEDAKALDAAVRADPLAAYEPDGVSLQSIRG